MLLLINLRDSQIRTCEFINKLCMLKKKLLFVINMAWISLIPQFSRIKIPHIVFQTEVLFIILSMRQLAETLLMLLLLVLNVNVLLISF